MGQVTPCNPMAWPLGSQLSIPFTDGKKNRSDSPFSPDELSFLAESDVAARVNGSPLSHSDRFSIVPQTQSHLSDISGIFRSEAFSG